MMRHGSLVNHLTADATNEFKVGDGVTLLGWSDRNPATVVAIKGKRMSVQADTAVRTDKNGMSEMQDYEFTPNPNGAIYQFSKRRNGAWVAVGRPMGQGTKLGAGRSKYRDFSF